MSAAERQAEDAYEAQNDPPREDIGEEDNDYVSRTGQKQAPVPVVSDREAAQELDDNSIPSNSDEQLEADEKDAISKENIIGSSKKGIETRGAKPAGSYSEGPEEDDIPRQ